MQTTFSTEVMENKEYTGSVARKRFAAAKSGQFFSYFTIVVVAVFILTIYSMVVIFQLNKEAETNNEKFTVYFKSVLENALTGISDFAYNVMYNNYSLSLINYGEESAFNEEELNYAGGLRQEIYTYINSNKIIEDVMEYFPHMDKIVGNNGYYSSFVYFKSKNTDKLESASEENYFEWLDSFFHHSRSGFYCQKNDVGQNTIFYYCSIPYPLNESLKRMVVIQLDETGLRETLKDLVIRGDYEYAALVDSDGTVFASSGDLPFDSVDELYSQNKHTSQYSVVHTKSDLCGLDCITVQARSSAYKIVRTVTAVLMIGFVAILVVGGAVALYFAEQNHKKVRVIAERFPSKHGEGGVPTLDYIGERIDLLIENNKTIVDEAYRQQRIVDYSFLKELLNTPDCNSNDINLLLTIYDEEFNGGFFQYIAIKHGAEDIIARPMLYKLLCDFEDETFQAFYTDIFEVAVILCNYSTEQGKIDKLATALEQCDIGATEKHVFLGEAFSSATDIGRMWQEISRDLWSEKELDDHRECPEIQDSNKSMLNGSRDIAGIAHGIVTTEYCDAQLSLQSLADRVGVSQVYLSKLFKQEYGMSVMRYVNYLRIEAAKELIMNGSDNLQVVAHKVGFISDVNFIRVFKKYEKTTPGLYRSKNS